MELFKFTVSFKSGIHRDINPPSPLKCTATHITINLMTQLIMANLISWQFMNKPYTYIARGWAGELKPRKWG